MFRFTYFFQIKLSLFFPSYYNIPQINNFTIDQLEARLQSNYSMLKGWWPYYIIIYCPQIEFGVLGKRNKKKRKKRKDSWGQESLWEAANFKVLWLFWKFPMWFLHVASPFCPHLIMTFWRSIVCSRNDTIKVNLSKSKAQIENKIRIKIT